MYGRCEPRGGGGTADRTIAGVFKAHDGDGLMATLAQTNAARRREWQKIGTDGSAVLHWAMTQELVRCCSAKGKAHAELHFHCCLLTHNDRQIVTRYDQQVILHICIQQ